MPASAPATTASLKQSPPRGGLEELVVRAQAGDREAFGEIFDACFERVLRFAQAKLGPGASHAAEDAASAVFESLLTNIGRYDPARGGFVPWLLTICHRKIIDSWRSASSRLEVPIAEDLAGFTPPRSTPHDEHTTLMAQRSALAAAMRDLPERERDVLLCRFYIGLSLEETAAWAGSTVTAVRKRQRRAIDRVLAQVDTTEFAALGVGRATMN